MSVTPPRTGGHVVMESLKALGAQQVFGVPGQHALGMYAAIEHAGLQLVGLRTEFNAGFAADGWARISGAPAVLLVSTGPGALLSLAALQEAAAASIPIVAVGSQIPRAGLGGRRRGFLHELRDQSASFRDIVKSVAVVQQAGQVPSVLREAWETALTPPYGPVWVEVPEDVSRAEVDVPPVGALTVRPRVPQARPELLAAARDLLASAQDPVILAGGGVLRANASQALLSLAEALRAPVVTTFGGKGAFPCEHPLSLQSWLEDAHTTRLLEDADVVLALGTGWGELSTNYRTFVPRGRLVQVDADVGKLEANYPALALHADVGDVLRHLLAELPGRAPDGAAEERVASLLAAVQERLGEQSLDEERAILRAVRSAVPDDAPSFWDMTIMAYWAWSAWDPREAGRMHSAQGAGGLGYAFPAALGAAVALGGGTPVLAISGDGGAMYGIGELATAVQHRLNVTWLIVDDGGYGILREYMTQAYGRGYGTELAGPDFVALSASFGVPARRTTVDRLERDLRAALSATGPQVVVLPARPRMFRPTHADPRPAPLDRLVPSG